MILDILESDKIEVNSEVKDHFEPIKQMKREIKELEEMLGRKRNRDTDTACSLLKIGSLQKSQSSFEDYKMLYKKLKNYILDKEIKYSLAFQNRGKTHIGLVSY